MHSISIHELVFHALRGFSKVVMQNALGLQFMNSQVIHFVLFFFHTLKGFFLIFLLLVHISNPCLLVFCLCGVLFEKVTFAFCIILGNTSLLDDPPSFSKFGWFVRKASFFFFHQILPGKNLSQNAVNPNLVH